MKWPLVWRRHYDQACAAIRALEQTVAIDRALLTSALRSNDRLIDSMIAKASPAEGGRVALAPMKKPERDEVFDAIELQAGNDVTLRRHLTRWAKTKQLEGVEPTEIINAVLHWQADDENDNSGVATVS